MASSSFGFVDETGSLGFCCRDSYYGRFKLKGGGRRRSGVLWHKGEGYACFCVLRIASLLVPFSRSHGWVARSYRKGLGLKR
eukprot:1180953-Prorocentrum_minimum.AAC.6